MRAIDAVLGQPWAIEPEWLAMIAAIAERQFDAPVVAAMQNNAQREGRAGLEVTGGVAVIGLIGPIFPRANLMTEVSGATSLAMVQAQFREALASRDVHSIVLNIDSPGGVVAGIGDFAAEVAAGRKVKPVTAVVQGSMASAAYWIGSAASRVVASSTAMVGSIGVATAIRKQIMPDAKGEISIDIVSSNAPDKRIDAGDSAGRASIVATLDAVEAEFIGAVARNRGVTVDKVKADFGKGGVLVGVQAVAAGMVDAIGTLDSVLAKLTAVGLAGHSSPRAAAAASSEKARMSTPTTVAELTAAFPDLVAQIRSDATTQLAASHVTALNSARDEGRTAAETVAAGQIAAARTEGATAERARLKGIEGAALPGHEKLVAECKDDPNCSPGDAALRINAAERNKGATKLAALKADGATGAASVAAAEPAVAGSKHSSAAILADKTQSLEERCKAAFEADPDIRAEFGKVETLVAYQRAAESGQAKIFRPRQ